MSKWFISCAVLLCNLTSLFSLDTSYIFDGTTKGTLILETPAKNQKLVVKSLTLKNISNETVPHLALKVNTDTDLQKKLIQEDLIHTDNFMYWWGKHQMIAHQDGAYSPVLHSVINVPSREVPVHEGQMREYYFNHRWHLIDKLNHGYLALDNLTPVGYEEIADDPFLALRTKSTPFEEKYSVAKAYAHFASFNIFPEEFDSSVPEISHYPWQDIYTPLKPNEELVYSSNQYQTLMDLWKTGPNLLDLGSDKNPGIIQLHVEYEFRDFNHDCPVKVLNTNRLFHYQRPVFELSPESCNVDKIEWQISCDEHFYFSIPNLHAIENSQDKIFIDSHAEALLNPDVLYYLRLRALVDGVWSEWSNPYTFSMHKPESVKAPIFRKLNPDEYQIQWEYSKDTDTRFHIFASNSIDFIPSIYTDRQYKLIDAEGEEFEVINNLVSITTDHVLKIGTEFPYYRIIAESNGCYSTPSPIIHVYDFGLSIPRDVLQGLPSRQQRLHAERMAFPPAYAQLSGDLIPLRGKGYAFSLSHLHNDYYVQNPHVDPAVWNGVAPYFLPENHPVKSKLDRLFKKRVTQNAKTLKKAGFTQPEPMRFSKTIVTRNHNVPGYMFKFFSDEQRDIIDWKRCLRRVSGAIYIQEALNKYGLNHLFVVPAKFIYPLPAEPSPPAHLQRKNFIVVENEIDLYTGKDNNRMWKTPVINPVTLTWIYLLMQELGLNDSPYNFNMPVTKDNRVAFIDTEHHHKWPVPFNKLWQFLSPEMMDFWNKLCEKGGP